MIDLYQNKVNLKIKIMIDLQKIRKPSVLRDKIYYLCNHIKFYSIETITITVFYFFAQSLTLLSTFTASPIIASTPFSEALETINQIFFFYSSNQYETIDKNLILSHLISFLLVIIFIFIFYCGYTLEGKGSFQLTKKDARKIEFIKGMLLFCILFNIPIGSFTWYYIIKLFQRSLQYLAIIGLFNLGCLFVIVYIMEQCSIQSDLKYFKSLSRLYAKNESLHSITKMGVRMVIASFNNLTSGILALSAITLLIFDLYELKVSIFTKKYLQPRTEHIYYFKNVMTVIIELFMLICLLTSLPLIQDNFFAVVFSTSFLAYFSLSIFKDYKTSHLILEGIQAIKSSDEAKIYMVEMVSMLHQQTNKQEILTLSLVTIHRQKCQLPSCFCNALKLQQYSKSNNREDILQKFILFKLQQTAQKFIGDPVILSILLNYKLSVMGSLSKAYYLLRSHLQRSQTTMQSFSEQYMLYQAQQTIKKQIYNNEQGKRTNIQKIFGEQKLKNELSNLVIEVTDLLCEKYRLLSLEICNLNNVDSLCLKISNILRKIQSIWKNFSTTDSFNIKIYQIFLIYFQYVIFSKRQVSTLKTTILRKALSLQQLKGISQVNLQRYIYTQQACVTEIMFNKDMIGIVTNISSSSLSVFKCTRQQIIGKDFHQLMPQFFAFEHRNWSLKWFNNEKLTGKLLGLVNTYYVDNNGSCFSCILHMKLSSIGFQLKFYIILIKQNNSDYIYLNNKLQVQGLGNKLINDQILQYTLKKSIKQFTDINFQQLITFINYGQSIKKRIIFRNQTNLNYSQRKIALAILNITSDIQIKQPPESYINQCDVIIERRNISNYTYFIIKFLQARKLVRRNNSHIFKSFNSKNMETMRMNTPLYKRQYKDQIFEALQGNNNNLDSDARLKQNEGQQTNKDDLFQIHNISSIAESSIADANIIFSKLAQQIKSKAIDHRLIEDSRLTITTFGLIAMIIIVVGSSFIQAYIFQAGMQSYNQLIYASSSVSNNNQLFQIAYNRISTLKHYCQDRQSKNCKYLAYSENIILSKVYSLLIDNMQVYLLNKTKLNNKRWYSYYDKIIQLHLNNKIMNITIRQFLQYYYHSIKIINQIISIYNNQSKINQQIIFLQQNWNTLKYINKQSIKYYQQQNLNQLLFLIFIIYFIYFIYLITLILFLILIYTYYKYIQIKKQNIIRLHGYLSNLICNKLKIIGQNIKSSIIKSYIQIDISLQIEIINSSTSIEKYQYQQYHQYYYILILFFIIMIAINTLILYQITNIFTPAQSILSSFTKLIRSQIQPFQSYIQLKQSLIQNLASNNKLNFSQILISLNTTEIPFASEAKQMYLSLSQINSTLSSQFNQLLVSGVCSILTKDIIENSYCLTQTNYRISQKLGVVSALNFLSRNTLNIALQFIRNNKTSNIVYTTIFEDIDNLSFTLFRIYQLLQQVIMKGMKSAVTGISLSINNLVYLQLSLFTIALLYWIIRIDFEKKRLSDLYAQIFQYPQAILKENKPILKILQENLTLKI